MKVRMNESLKQIIESHPFFARMKPGHLLIIEKGARKVSFSPGELIVGNFGATQLVAHGIELRESSGAGPTWSAPEWRRFVQESQAAGWQGERVEFRHTQFATDASGRRDFPLRHA